MGRESVNNTIILGEYKTDGSAIPTIWTEKAFYTAKGTAQIQEIFGGKDFPYPKPVNLIYEVIQACTKGDSIIVDFFAGSGTTLQAVNLLNAEDDGHRKCIIVTNNEVSPKEERELKAMGLSPGDPEWEKHGIARSVTWPRTICTIEGHDIEGRPFEGDYPDIDRPMAEGFPANAIFFKLGFLDKASVRVGRQFREMLPTLWMKAGCHGPCPTCDEGAVPDMLILPQNHMAVLNDNSSYAAFAERVEQESQIDTVYLVTDSDADYRSMAKGLSAPHKYQLYREYLDNFRINSKR